MEENSGEPVIIFNPGGEELSYQAKLIHLNALVSKYLGSRQRVKVPIVENGEVPILVVNGIENRLAIFTISDIAKITKLYLLFDYTIDLEQFYDMTPFDIEFEDDNVHAHILNRFAQRENIVVTCPICNSPIYVSSAQFLAYTLGPNLHFCSSECRAVYNKNIRRV